MVMIIGIDLHGVINVEVSAFKWMFKIMVMQGRKIHIVSGPPLDEIKAELKKYGFEHGVHYHKVHSVVDYLKDKGVEMWLDYKKTWWANDKEWWSSKAKICEENGIEVMIDDKSEYAKYFEDIDAMFFLFDPDNKDLLVEM